MKIKVHSGIAASCIKQKYHHPYFLWSIAQKLSKGSGWCYVSELKRRYLKITNYSSEKTFYNHLKLGLDIFFVLSKNRIYLKSLKHIINYLKPITQFNNCILIDIGRRSVRSDELFTSIVVGSDKFQKPISIQYISKLLGRSVSTIKRNISKEIIHTVFNSHDGRQICNGYIFNQAMFLPGKKEKSHLKHFRLLKSC